MTPKSNIFAEKENNVEFFDLNSKVWNYTSPLIPIRLGGRPPRILPLRLLLLCFVPLRLGLLSFSLPTSLPRFKFQPFRIYPSDSAPSDSAPSASTPPTQGLPFHSPLRLRPLRPLRLGMIRNKNSDIFNVPRNNSERNSVIFLFRETGGIPMRQSVSSCFVFRQKSFFLEIGNPSYENTGGEGRREGWNSAVDQ
jgi:hypothetical protein